MLNPGLALLRFLHISEPATQTFILAFMIGAAWSWVSWSGAKSGCLESLPPHCSKGWLYGPRPTPPHPWCAGIYFPPPTARPKFPAFPETF